MDIVLCKPKPGSRLKFDRTCSTTELIRVVPDLSSYIPKATQSFVGIMASLIWKKLAVRKACLKMQVAPQSQSTH